MRSIILLVAGPVLAASFCALIRNERATKKTLFAAAQSVGAAIVFYAFCSFDILQNPQRYAPIWFEDLLLYEFFIGMVFLILFATRKIKSDKLIYGLLVFIFSLAISLECLELLLKHSPLRNLRTNRMGLGVRHIPNDSYNKKLFMNIPDRVAQEKMNNEQLSMRSYLNFNETDAVPSPQKNPGEKRVLWLGDSMVESVQVPVDVNFTSLLERETGIKHFNFGTGGSSIDFSFAMLKKYSDMISPDLVILGFYIENDYREFGQQYAACDFSPLFIISNGEFIYQCDSEPKLTFSKAYAWPPNIIFQIAADKTILGNYLLNIRNSAYDAVAKKYYKPNPFQFDYQKKDIDVSNARSLCDMVKEINNFAAGRGIKFAIALMPYVFRNSGNPETPLKEPIEANTFRDCVNSTSIPFMDVQKRLTPEQVSMDDKQTIFLSDHHMNEYGHKVFSEILKPFEENLLRD